VKEPTESCRYWLIYTAIKEAEARVRSYIDRIIYFGQSDILEKLG